MSDKKEEGKKEPPPRKTYAEQLAELREEGVKESKQKREELSHGTTVKLSSSEEEIAEALSNLMNNKDFKVYLEMEAMEQGDRLVRAFDKPAKADFDSADFGEQMAFNKGRSHQMTFLRLRRQQILMIYSNNKNREGGGGGENGTS